MVNFRFFIIRAVLGVFFSVVLARLFYPQASLVFIAGLCAVLVALAYLTEYLRQRKKEG